MRRRRRVSSRNDDRRRDSRAASLGSALGQPVCCRDFDAAWRFCNSKRPSTEHCQRVPEFRCFARWRMCGCFSFCRIFHQSSGHARIRRFFRQLFQGASLRGGATVRRVCGGNLSVAALPAALERNSGCRFKIGDILYRAGDSTLRRQFPQRSHWHILLGFCYRGGLLESSSEGWPVCRSRPVPGRLRGLGYRSFSWLHHRVCHQSRAGSWLAHRARGSSHRRKGRLGLELCRDSGGWPSHRR
jgi:hypothetical protein